MVEIECRVQEIISGILECDKEGICNGSGLTRTFGWDSLNHVLIMTVIGQQFDIEINEKNIVELITFEEICKYLKSCVHV